MRVIGKRDSERVRKLAAMINGSSKADFVRRLLDERRKYLVNDGGGFSTHELAYRDDGRGNAVVYPLVQSVGNGLHRFDDDMAYDRAVYLGDTLNMRTPDAKAFTEGYKSVYPMYFQPELAPVGDLTSAYEMEPPESRGLVPFMYEPGEAEVVEEPVVDLFSDEAKARRRVKQRYAESKFNDKAFNKGSKAQGAWQIVPITYQDYLGRGKGKAGDLDDPEYNGKIRDFVMGIIPRDLKKHWSEDDSDLNKLAKLYAAYNWGAGNLRSYFSGRLSKGLSNDDPHEWVEGLNPETKRYVKYLVFDEDFDDGSGYTTKGFEEAAKAKGYMAKGGRLFEDGGPEKQNWFTRMMLNSVMNDPYTGAVATASGWTRGKEGNVTQTEEAANSEGAKRLRSSLAAIAPVALGGMFGGAGITGTADASTMMGVGRLATPMLGMGAFNAGLRSYTPWKNWADFALNVPMFENGNSVNSLLGYYPGADEKWGIKDWAHSAAELANPAIFLPYGKIADAGIGFMNGASKYIEGVKDRLAESVVRMADTAASTPQFIPFQVFSPRGISYILNPRASNLAYKLPFKYSGNTLSDDVAHAGDLVDQWIGKSPVEGARYDYDMETFPKDFVSSMRKLYGDKINKFPLVEFETKPEATVGMPRDIKRIFGKGRNSWSASNVKDVTGSSRVDPGRHGRYLKTDENGNYYWDNWDLWKFHPDTQVGNGLPNLLRGPARFVDDRGTPIIFHWKTPIDFMRASEELPIDYWTGIKYGSFDDGLFDFGVLDKIGIRPGYEYEIEPVLASGGKIHIRPENRGKFTALKKRTGHSASWFKAHGTPAQKKMAVFELNSRKWRHDNGGLLKRYDDAYQLGQVYDLSEEQVNELIRQGYEVERV